MAKSNPTRPRLRHGMWGTPEYICWIELRRRCTNPSNKGYKHYGGRGIRVCDRWLKFENFLADMGHKPPGHRIGVERIDNDGNYEPGNCKWATPKEQTRNRRNSRLVTLREETRCLGEWAEIVGIGFTTLDARLRRGMSDEQALTTPLNHEKSHLR